MDLSAVAVLIPALDEEASLPGVLAALPDGLSEVVVVDNGSRDRTAEVARRCGATVVVEPRRGYGSACLAGLAYLRARDRPPDVVVFLDADHSDDPSLLALLAGPVRERAADLVLGVRTWSKTGVQGGVPAHADLGTRLILALLSLLFGRRFHDLPPFRAIRFSSLVDLNMDDTTWGWTLQMQIRAIRRGLSVREIDLPYRRRPRGRSKISGTLWGSMRVGLRMFYTLARERMRS